MSGVILAFSQNIAQAEFTRGATFHRIPTSDNSSFLYNQDYFGSIPTLESKVMDPGICADVRSKAERLRDEEERRHELGMSTLYATTQYQTSIREISDDAFKRFREQNLDWATTQARKSAWKKYQEDPVVGRLKGPVGTIALLAGIYRGEVLEHEFADGHRVKSKTEVVDPLSDPNLKRQELGYQSDLVSTTIEFSPLAEARYDPRHPPEDGLKKGERLKVSAAREIPLVKIGTGISYGTSTQTYTGSFSRRLIPDVIGYLDHSRSFFGSRIPESTLRIVFEKHF